MNKTTNRSKRTATFFLTALLLAPLATLCAAEVTAVYDTRIPQCEFAAGEIRAASTAATSGALKIIIEVGREQFGAQAYRIERPGADVVRVVGSDANGAMYGGLDVAESLRLGTLAGLTNGEHKPFIARRGLKLNLPLDLRTPSYTDPSDAAQANIPEVWSMDFWREFLDDMARHRYNVLSLWSLNPFPSLVKVPEFLHVALDDVWRTTAKLDDHFSNDGDNFVRPEMLASHEVVKKITMDGKIQFWRDVMQLAKDRGVDVYLFTWNIFLNAAEGKDGIPSNKGAPRTIEYFRASVRETIKTYPLLAGFGITAGESMPTNIGGLNKEQWLWKTYGEGIRDGLKETPGRKFRLIHRFHMTALSDIQREFGALSCPLDLSFKYAVAHMYSVPNPNMIQPVLPLLSPERRCWLTVRNDDIYSFRWADADYARAFIKAIPGEDKIAGFYMGPDGYFWGRDFLSKDAATPRQTVIRKQWLSFALWGRLAYEPDLPAATFTRLTTACFPGADVPKLTAAWADASKTFPYITRFFWGPIDIRSCRKKTGFYTVRNFVEGGTMPGAGVLNIVEWRTQLTTGKKFSGTTPMEIAATLEANAARAQKALPELRRATVTPAASAKEYAATLGDIEAMAHLGLYYAAKIRGACDLALFDKTADAKQQASAVRHLEAALRHWQNYSAAYTRQYVQPVLYNRAGVVDIRKQTADVAADVQMARDWKPGTIREGNIKLAGGAAVQHPAPGRVEFFVAPNGSDRATGSSEAPFATLARAQRAVREALARDREQNVTVIVRAGTYELPEPLVFGLDDSPSPTATVTYRAEDHDTVILSGGQRLTGWIADTNGTWALTVPGVKEGRWFPRQLFVHGERRTRARSPNTGFYRGLQSDDARRVAFPPGTLQLWSDASQVELVTFVEWTPSRVRLGTLEVAGNRVEFNAAIFQFFDQPWGQHIRANMGQFPFYFENAPEMLDAPGEWHLDRRTGRLRYVPRPGERTIECDATLPRLEQLVIVRGGADRPVRNLRFEGLTFAHTDWALPEGGFLPDQAGFFDTENARKGLPVPAATLDFQYANACVLEGCRFTGLGGHAIRFREGCASNTVARCAMDGVGGNGVSLGLFDAGASEADTVRANVVRDCTIRRCGLDYAGCVGIWVGIARDTRIAHNELTDLPYAGVSCGWSWDRRDVGCRNNVIEGNHIHHVGQLLADTGGIYVLGDQPGGVIRGNHIHDIRRFSGLASVNGIFFDNGSRGWRVEDNVIQDIADGAIRHNDNLPADQAWGTNHLDLKPDRSPAAATLVRQAGPSFTSSEMFPSKD